jgi:hypothetical protein
MTMRMAVTRRLKEAFRAAAKLSAEEQNRLAMWIMEEIESEQRWDQLFGDPRSDRLLARLAAEAIEEDEAGLTEEWE